MKWPSTWSEVKRLIAGQVEIARQFERIPFFSLVLPSPTGGFNQKKGKWNRAVKGPTAYNYKDIRQLHYELHWYLPLQLVMIILLSNLWIDCVVSSCWERITRLLARRVVQTCAMASSRSCIGLNHIFDYSNSSWRMPMVSYLSALSLPTMVRGSKNSLLRGLTS